MIKFVNRAKMTTATTGTASSIALGSAVDGFQTLAAAGVNNGDVVHFVINDGQNWELAEGTFTSATNTLSRTTLESNNAGSPINLSGEAMVAVTALASDLVQPADLSTVATTGAYADLSGKPTLGTAAATNSTAYATAAQGIKADSALQPGNIGSTVQGYNANIVIDGSYVHTDNNYTTAEKSKLAGIEAGATADQTAAEILTALKTVDGAGSALDADTLDTKQLATIESEYKAYADAAASSAAASIVDTAPAALDTLNELAAALGDDPNFATTVSTQIGTKLDATANAVSASKWLTARTITLAGDLSGSVSINGTANVTLTAAVADDSHNHVIGNIDGLQTALDAKQPLAAVLTNTTASFTTALNTKLSGIETGATADQTAAEILTALKTVDGFGSGLDADLLDGNHATAFATAAQGVLANSAVQPGDAITTLSNTAGYVGTSGGAFVSRTANKTLTQTASLAATTLDFSQANDFILTLSASTTLTFSNAIAGQSGVIFLLQDATGGRVITLPTAAKTPKGGAALAQVTTANSVSILSYIVLNSTSILVNYIGDFQ